MPSAQKYTCLAYLWAYGCVGCICWHNKTEWLTIPTKSFKSSVNLSGCLCTQISSWNGTCCLCGHACISPSDCVHVKSGREISFDSLCETAGTPKNKQKNSLTNTWPKRLSVFLSHCVFNWVAHDCADVLLSMQTLMDCDNVYSSQLWVRFHSNEPKGNKAYLEIQLGCSLLIFWHLTGDVITSCRWTRSGYEEKVFMRKREIFHLKTGLSHYLHGCGQRYHSAESCYTSRKF